MRILLLISVFVVFGLLSTTQKIQAQEADGELGIYEKLDQYLPSDLVFTDQDYNEVNFVESIDKPTVLALVYYTCPGICTPLLEGVADVITKSDLDLGTEYDVYTVSFDYTEKPKLAKDKKKTFSNLVKGKDTENGWTYFTGDSTNVNNLLNSIGYKVKKEGEEYIHPAAIVMLSPDGKITRYLHGTYFLPFDLKMAVVEAGEGRSGPTINKVLQFCFSYDPDGQKYVLNITRISGTLILSFAVLLFLGLIFKNRKKKSIIKEG